ncbi:probable Spindle assembly checkpoint kinase [Zygosaccharomyces bailii]|nr:probable Spindle assembly checkpoint kinase [Zygosaccharomyces bailii]
MSNAVNVDAAKARRDSLLQRNMLLSMRLNHSGNKDATHVSRLPAEKPNTNWRASLGLSRRLSTKSTSPVAKVTTSSSVNNKINGKRYSPARTVPPSHQAKLNVKPMSLDDFELGKKLGKGKFGRVYCVKHKKTGFICAMKVMEKQEIVQYNVQKQFRREVEIQSSLNHQNLTKLYGYFHDEKRVYLLMEYSVNGELYKLLRSRGPLNDIYASHYIYQVADALDYMHQRNIIHRDVKPENVLIGFDNTVKLTDFGWSIISPRGVKRKTLCGTIDYLSPELINLKPYDDKVDVWALGVLAYELVTNAPPFEEDTKDLTCKRIVKGDLRFPSHVSSDAQDLITQLLRHNSQDRISLRDVKNHPWLVKNKPFW